MELTAQDPQIGPDELCALCGESPASGAWDRPCEESRDGLHWLGRHLQEQEHAASAAVARSLSRAALELEKAAGSIEALSPRLQRKLPFELSPAYLRIEAERARDTLHVYDLLDR